MQNRYIVQAKTQQGGRWESINAFDRLQEAINYAASESRLHEGAAIYRVWDKQASESRYERGHLD